MQFPNFKPVELADKALFDKFFSTFPPIISELTFTNIFSWRLTKKHEFSILDNHLIVSFFEDNKRKFYQPIGNNPEDMIKNILKIFPENSFERVEKTIAEKLTNELNVIPNRDMHDYVYKISELRELKGGNYVSKRNFIKRFKKYNPKTCLLDEDTVSHFLELQEKWCHIKNCNADKALNAEDLAIKESLGNFKKLNIFGICILIDNRIQASAIGEPLNKDTFVEHFEKANTEFTGIYQYLLHEFVENIPESFEFINREQDLGISGLRKAKLSYNPSKLIEKYSITQK